MYKLSKKSRKNMVGIHPILAFAVEMAIKETKQDFTVLEGVRDMVRQREMVANGSSKTLRSYHLNGLAVDLVAYVNGTVTWEEKYYREIGRAMKAIITRYNLPIEWGFEKWGWDIPHWQMTGYRNKYDIRKIHPKCFKG